ncbi:hypothetical protein VTJ49DRAFT_3321 [Mycothermus thermophilus]|uniref:C2 NT-type domain-containing protein n=1 Tax=Humicola insolens TaxID=85995 RepID=A0ABR3V7S0_HUMIN
MQLLSLVGKTRKPKFEVHLKIADLNNVPLASGGSFVKWHLPGSIHKEHRGRTQKCPILNHRVEYNYAKVLVVRIPIDRNQCLAECAIEFEVIQEFSATGSGGGGVRDEKVTLGHVRLNLSEYVDESEAILRDTAAAATLAARDSFGSPVQKSGHRRNRSSLSNVVPSVGDESSPRSSRDEDHSADHDVQDGVVRRHLLQESKINSTLKVSILMVQVDGDRNFVAPPPKSTPVFGAIAGFVASDALEPVDPGANTLGNTQTSLAGKSRDVYELQDMYRRALAASWVSQPGELPADQCIEDIFGGGDGFIEERGHSRHHHHHHHHRHHSSHHKHHHLRRPTIAHHTYHRPGSSSSSTSPPNFRQDSTLTAIFGPASSSSSALPSDNDNNTDDNTTNQPGNSNNNNATLRPRDAAARLRRQLSHQTVLTDRSGATTVVPTFGDALQNINNSGISDTGLAPLHHHHQRDRNEPFPSFSSTTPIAFHAPHHHRREDSKITHADLSSPPGGFPLGSDPRSRSSSMVSLAATTSSTASDRFGNGNANHGYQNHFAQGRDQSSDELDYGRGRAGGLSSSMFKRAREVGEFEVRDDLVAWTIPSGTRAGTAV